MLQLPHAIEVMGVFHCAQLRKDVVPKTAENFRALCTGKANISFYNLSCPTAVALKFVIASVYASCDLLACVRVV